MSGHRPRCPTSYFRPAQLAPPPAWRARRSSPRRNGRALVAAQGRAQHPEGSSRRRGRVPPHRGIRGVVQQVMVQSDDFDQERGEGDHRPIIGRGQNGTVAVCSGPGLRVSRTCGSITLRSAMPWWTVLGRASFAAASEGTSETPRRGGRRAAVRPATRRPRRTRATAAGSCGTRGLRAAPGARPGSAV